MKSKIGFIDIGIMGSHMSRHLLEAGYQVIAYDRNQETLDRAVALGAEQGSSCQNVAGCSDVVITMLPDSPDVEQAALGPDGIMAAAREGLIYIDMSTIAPDMATKVAKQLGQKGVRCLDAPVSGAR